jgi:molybdopterin converting factor subunit 1
MSIKITLLSFGIAKEITGQTTLPMELPRAMSHEEFRQNLNATYPALAALKSYALAINKTYAQPNDTINPGDEVAILPPVSGG